MTSEFLLSGIFFARSHDKGAYDGLGGTVKHLAARASLQRPYDEQIMTPRQLFEWASSSIPAVSFEYCSTDNYKREKTHLERQFERARTIPEVQFHGSHGLPVMTQIWHAL